MSGKIKTIALSAKKGTKKTPVSQAEILTDYGIKGDVHAGKGKRQVSLLDIKYIEMARRSGLDVGPGEFAENITISFDNEENLDIGSIIITGNGIELEVTQIGKECHDKCEIFNQLGECSMSDYGIFTRVINGGTIKTGDSFIIK